MAIKKNTTKETAKVERPAYEYKDIKVSRVKENKNKEDCYRFNLTVNGITLYGCQYITYTAKNGDRSSFISFPSYKGTDGKWYNHCYFPIEPGSKAFEEVEKQIGDELNKADDLPF